MVNPLHLQQIQTNQREELTNVRKSEMEQCELPNTRPFKQKSQLA